jgi:prevent-host-death family protein
MVVNVKEVREHFATYVSRAEQGEEIVLTRNGQVVARLVPPEPSAVLDPDLLASRRDRLSTSEDLPNLVLLARQEERY